jgi:hypothetical protein
MSEKPIKLTIQEIVKDFETLVRYDEYLDLKFDLKKANDKDIEKFYSEMLRITEKYIPTYEKFLPEEYHMDKSTAYDKALILYKMLYENFLEIFSGLV